MQESDPHPREKARRSLEQRISERLPSLTSAQKLELLHCVESLAHQNARMNCGRPAMPIEHPTTVC